MSFLECTVMLYPNFFAGTAKNYSRFRPAWPKAAIAAFCERFPVETHANVLDLGCGPGLLTMEIAACGYRTTGVDPEPEMIEEAMRIAPDLTWRQNSAEASEFADATFDLVVMARSFQWMDRGTVLEKIRRWLRPGGSVVVISDPSTNEPCNAWWGLFEEVIAHWNPNYDATGDDWIPNRQFFAEAPGFSALSEIRLPVERLWTVDQVIGLALTTSGTRLTRERGDQADFSAAMREHFSHLQEPLLNRIEIEILIRSI